MSRRKKDSVSGVVIGPILVLLAMAALWKNETRFDYYRAASRTRAVASISDVQSNQTFSYTGAMNQDLEIPGEYVEAFTGQLVVYRTAEIYCWDRDEDDEGHVNWSLEWMSSVQSNSRNSGLRQELQSRTLLPDSYQVGDLPVLSSQLEFVDAARPLNPQTLKRTSAGQRLEPTDSYLFLRKNGGNQLGDERVSYSAIPVPPAATYFGKFVDGQGVADTSQERSGFIAGIIRDTGILHHLVGGDRQQALASMKRHITRLKWIVRGAGSAVVVVGFLFFFSALLKFLFHIPVIGWLAEKGAFLMALGMGIPVAGLTIAAGFLAGHPVLLAVLVLLIGFGGVAGYWAFRGEANIQQSMREDLGKLIGHELGSEELKEREFLQISQLVGRHSGLGVAEVQMLDQWGRKQRWSAEKRKDMLQQAKAAEVGAGSALALPPGHLPDAPGATDAAAPSVLEPTTDENLRGLIRLAVADGELTAYEMRAIQSAAMQAGYTRQQVWEVMQSAKRSAELRSNLLQSRAGN